MPVVRERVEHELRTEGAITMQVDGSSQLPLLTEQLSQLKSPKDVQRIADQLAASKADEVAQEFEAVFTSMLLKQMRNSLQEGLFPGDTSDVYGGMFDLFIGQHLSSNSALGVDRMVREYLESVPLENTGNATNL